MSSSSFNSRWPSSKAEIPRPQGRNLELELVLKSVATWRRIVSYMFHLLPLWLFPKSVVQPFLWFSMFQIGHYIIRYMSHRRFIFRRSFTYVIANVHFLVRMWSADGLSMNSGLEPSVITREGAEYNWESFLADASRSIPKIKVDYCFWILKIYFIFCNKIAIENAFLPGRVRQQLNYLSKVWFLIDSKFYSRSCDIISLHFQVNVSIISWNGTYIEMIWDEP